MCVSPPSPPAPPPPPIVEPRPVERPDDSVMAEDDGGSKARRRARVQARGRRSTLMTGPSGVTEQANLGRATLLGG